MDLLLILTYTALCIAIFKVFNIPLNKWTVPTAVLGGVVLVGTLVLLMNYNHSFTQLGNQVFPTTPIVSGVRGRVVEVPVQANQPLKTGDILFKIDLCLLKRKSHALKRKKKQAKVALGLESDLREAEAAVLKAQADRDKAQREFSRYQRGFDRGAFTEQDLDTRRQAYKAAEAMLDVAILQQEQAQIALESEIGGENTQVAQLLAELRKAEFNLEQTVVRAPTDGYVTQLALRPGVMAVPLPLAPPAMTFVHTEDITYTAAFRQNSLQRLKAGFEAEFMFRAIPGKVFRGEVIDVIPAIGESQIQARGALLGTDALRTSGRVFAKLKITDDLSEYHLPMGTAVEVAVYSDSFTHVSVMRKVLIRMKSWQNYLYLDH
ncbi:LOW QUALITY PROTEIN: membrane fusion component of tripartite multidrug resistance system [Vibrio sp. JCM 18905]|nr:LOW QUALITY PROTEIN: membrane fusion component of tripartite multidrug resistance system [Vibrio sp. JCM 18905]